MSAADSVQLGGGWPRRVMPEILDQLPAGDPRAIRSRRDLRVVNRIMGSCSLLVRALGSTVPTKRMRLIELGSGDGTLTLRLARRLARRWPKISIVLLDREPAVSAATLAAFNDLGWSAEVVAADVLDWFEETPRDPQSVIFANLFVHHFAGERLTRLLEVAARCSRFFVCCEPRRSKLALAASRLLGLIGCNAVTRHDAVVSVHAGFRDRELSMLWPKDRSVGWRLDEHAAGAFSHLFVAARDR
jgi:hypothetical protein